MGKAERKLQRAAKRRAAKRTTSSSQPKDQQPKHAAEGVQGNNLGQGEPGYLSPGATLPVFCGHCGLVFSSRAFDFGNSTNVTLTGNKESCPRCGRLAEIPDGTFNFVGDTMEVLEATPLTRARLSGLADALSRVRAGELSEDELADEVEREGGSTALAELLRKASPRVRHALIMVLIFAIGQLAQYELTEHLSDTATQPELHHDLGALAAQLRGDQRRLENKIHADVEMAVRQALAAYNAERHPAPHPGP
jgi:hypothetical protein